MKQLQKIHSNVRFPVVGIGASAGGFPPVKKMISEIPIDSGMAYVIALNHSDYENDLAEILKPYSKIPVYEVINDFNFVPNHIYVIPEQNNLINVNGGLQLEKRRRGASVHRALDIFFESLVAVHKRYAVGILFSGTSFDGTIGLKKIKELGGITIAQNPDMAEFATMPKSAIDADAADYVFSPESIPSQLIDIHGRYENSQKNDSPENQLLHKITNIVFLRSGNSFKHYSLPVIRKRIEKRVVVKKMETMQRYYNLLNNETAEQDNLFNDLLIPVTYFFRDEDSFEKLSHDVFPTLIENATSNNLRIWIAGCSTGEEAYSMAIMLHEFLTERKINDMRVQIFGTDVSEKSITKARCGVYTLIDVQQVGESRLSNYFTKRQGNYCVNKIIRNMCVFTVHNLIAEPPFAGMDMISCRNVLNYFDDYLQNKVLASFHNVLKENGFLFLGKPESAYDMKNLFEPLGTHEKIYMRKTAPEHQILTKELPSNNAELRFINDELLNRHEQLMAERSYSESIISILREPLVLIDKDFIVKSCNPAYYKYFETNPENTEGYSFLEIGNRQWNNAEFKSLIQKVISEKTAIEDYKIEVLCPGKGKKTMMVNIRNIIDAKPVDMLLIAIEDVSELQVKSDSLNQRNIELEEYNEQLKIFSTAASQDLQEPLGKIQMFCSKLMDEQNISPAGSQYLERLMHTAEGMEHLIHDLIDYTRISLPENDFKKTNLNAKLKKLETRMKDMLDKKKAVITVSELPQIKLLQYQVIQLFTSLISNSIKYVADGNAPKIKIWSEEPTSEEIKKLGGMPDLTYVKINFSDNGIGFNEDHKDKIFEPFYRLHSKDKYEGSGLGLSVVKKIVANHNGFITVSSELKSGTTFHIYFPVV